MVLEGKSNISANFRIQSSLHNHFSCVLTIQEDQKPFLFVLASSSYLTLDNILTQNVPGNSELLKELNFLMESKDFRLLAAAIK